MHHRHCAHAAGDGQDVKVQPIPKLCIIFPAHAVPGFWEQDLKVSPISVIYHQGSEPSTKVKDLQAEVPGGRTRFVGQGDQKRRSCPPKSCCW